MNLTSECLEPAQVELLLQGNLTPPEYATAQEHLEACEQCRARVEEKIGPQQWWGDVQSVLLNSRSALFAKGQASSADAEAHVTPTAKLLDLLGPTDDPHMLGRIGSYEIIGLLGQGGMGAVFKGFDRSLNRFVAIKMLLPHLAASGAARKRFAREGQAVAAVVDDHVMAIHCVDEWQGVPYLVMTYSRGVSLQKRLCDNGPLEVREILRIGMQAAKGLAAAHAQGIVHRDIKPANIFLDQNVERVQLMDFGLARAVDDASLTRSGTLAGTPQYMSPEQARAETVDHRSDLFSLGSVLYAMCTGHAPFRAESSYSVLRLITDKEPRPIREINPDIPEWLCAIISKLMAKHTDDRFESAQQVAELLEDCLAHVQHPSTTPLPASIAAAARKIVQRPPIGKFIAAAAFAFSLILAGVLIVLELNKGTLTIESEADDIPIRIVHEKEIVERLTVMKSGAITRLKAGEYTIEIDAPNSDLKIVNNRVSLSRGENEIVKIVLSSYQGDELAKGLSNNDKRTKDIALALREDGIRLQALHGFWEFLSVESDGVVTQYKTPIELTVKENLWTVSNSMTGGNRFELDGPNITFHGLTSTGNTSGVGGDTPSIAYGIYELNGDTLTYAMTEFSPASFVGEQTGGHAGPSIQHPQGFVTKGNSNRVYRLRRSSRIPSETDHASSRSNIDSDDIAKVEGRASEDATKRNEQLAAKHRAWQQSEPYQGPSFDTFFPDDVEGGLLLDTLWNASDRETFSDQEILDTVRRGLRRTREHRTLILGWIGNKYIWNKSPQNSDAIEIMYHAADFSGERADPYGTRHYAVYFGLSVVQPKTPAILRTLAELAMRVDDPNDLDRIAWGTRNQNQELLSCLQPFHVAADESARKKAEVCRKIFSGELKAFVWAAEQARVKAEQNYADQLPRFREILLSGSSEKRLEVLKTVLRERIALIMDDAFITAFAQCAKDPRPEIRNQVAIIAGARWVWEADQQSSEAIELMLELSSDDDRQVRYNAVYYGLSTVRNKSDAVVKRLLELAFVDREPNLFHRIQWGLREDHERVEKMLLQYQEGANEEHARAAHEVFDAMLGRDNAGQVAVESSDQPINPPVPKASTRPEPSKTPIDESKSTTTISPEVPAEGRPVDKDKLLNELRERDRKFSGHSIELERTWNEAVSPRGMASEVSFQNMKAGEKDTGIPEGLPEDYEQPHRIRYIWTGKDFESTLEVLADLETAIHPEYAKVAPRTVESDCFNYQRFWNRDQEIFSHSSKIAKLSGGKKAWEFLLPSGIGFTPSILSVSNAVEVDDGYVLKGLIGLPSATIGNRKNCFEAHFDKEMILRKAVIQYHVYDFVIVTFGRTELRGTPPLAKLAAVSIHHIGQDEKRLGDVGNYKYEVISLSEKLSKAEYDLRVNFAIPTGTKLAAGLNLVEVTLQGLPGVTQAERDQPAARHEMIPRDPEGPEQPMLSRTLQQLQGKWRLMRQIAADGAETNALAIAIWEFQGDRIIVRDGGPGGLMLIQVDDETTPVQVNLSLETDDESGLGLLSVEGDKLILCLGISQKAPEPESRPEKLQWVSGVWYMELQRVKPGEMIVPIKPEGQVQQHAEASPLLLSPTAIPPNTPIDESKKSAVDHRNARSVVEAYVALALAGDVAQAAALAKNAPADPKHIAEIPEFLNVQRLKVVTVYVNDPANPTRALATSEAVRLDADHKQPDGQRDGFIVCTLERTDENWTVIDIDFESESGAEKELKRFLEANPSAIGLPPIAQAE